MAYSTSNPPRLVTQGVGGLGSKIWIYESTSDAAAAVDTIGYFTNGYDLGMRAGDIVIANLSQLVSSFTVISAVSTNVDLGTGTTIGSTANSD